MQNGDKIVYLAFRGKMTPVGDLPPQDRRKRPNFVITWRGMDWSGFRTLEECEKQFLELEKSHSFGDFAVVER